MTTDYRALCDELAEAYAWCIEEYMTAPAEEDTLIQRARALLAQPMAEGPTDEKLLSLVAEVFGYVFLDGGIGGGESEFLAYARAAIAADRARYGRPTPQPEPAPVAVSERPWERDDWCDALGKVFRQGQ